ncbi:hypothetical protein LCGC14_3114460, partial [marine sediment metagenome]
VYGTDCEKAWKVEAIKTSNGVAGRAPSEVIRGFIDGTLDILKKSDKDAAEKFVVFKGRV